MIIKMQSTNHVIYLLEDCRGKSVAEAFYEYELHRAHPDLFRRDVYFVYCARRETRCTSSG